VSGQERWAYGLPEPVRRRPVLSLTVAGVVAGFGVGLAIGWRWSR
jgi:hypothetical protein